MAAAAAAGVAAAAATCGAASLQVEVHGAAAPGLLPLEEGLPVATAALIAGVYGDGLLFNESDSARAFRTSAGAHMNCFRCPQCSERENTRNLHVSSATTRS